MNAHKLAHLLLTMPPDAEVRMLWDSEPRTTVEHVWLARAGYVVLADSDEPVSSVKARPHGVSDDPYNSWHTPR